MTPLRCAEVPRTGLTRTSVLVTALLLVGCTVTGCLTQDQGSSETDIITLYGFSVKGEVFDSKIIPAFKAHWKKETGKKVEFETNYAGSGRITKQVITGAPAEVMILSTEWDALQLEKNGLTTTDWRTFQHNGTVSMSPWVILTRKDNPKAISDFPDLTAKDIDIVHADPTTSGGACWSVFAVYGSELVRSETSEGNENETAAENLLRGVIKNVISWQSSARQALSQFSLGYGDAFITYENEALLARSQGKDYEIVYPKSTIYSEHKVVIVDKNVAKGEREVVEAFVDFLYTHEVQGYLADHGFRSLDDDINAGHPEFQPVEMPFTVDRLGGWEKAHKELIDGLFTDIKG